MLCSIPLGQNKLRAVQGLVYFRRKSKQRTAECTQAGAGAGGAGAGAETSGHLGPWGEAAQTAHDDVSEVVAEQLVHGDLDRHSDTPN